MKLIDEEFDVTISTNTGIKKVDNCNIVLFEGNQKRYYGREIPNKYAYTAYNHGEDTIIAYYHFNCKGNFTILENSIPIALVKHSARYM